MAIPLFLAQTSAEFLDCPAPPGHTAWMGCDFSLRDTGITGLPPSLPEGSALILTDRIPPAGHAPARIREQLRQTVQTRKLRAVILDLQRPGVSEVQALCADLVSSLDCPVVVSEPYSRELECPVFLSPCPQHVPLAAHIAPWSGRRLWLDLAADAQVITITKAGCRILPFPPGKVPAHGRQEEGLHCHYSIEAGMEAVQFTLWRTPEDLAALAAEAEVLGVEALVGLYCELGAHPPGIGPAEQSSGAEWYIPH